MWTLNWNGQQFAVTLQAVRIGSAPDNTIVLPDKQVSPHHATIWEAQDALLIRDEGSASGTFVNGTRVIAPFQLRAGDQIQIGSAILTPLVVGSPGTVPASAAPPRARSSFNPLLLISIIVGVLLVCLVVGGVLAVMTRQSPSSTLVSSASLSATPTQTTIPSSTPTSAATPTPKDTATNTATSVPTLTPLPSVTSTPATDTSVVFTDNFSSSCNLPKEDDADHTFECENGEYTMLMKTANYSWWRYYRDQYDDAVIEADARAVSGDAGANYGIAFRVASDGNSFYRFGITTDGHYSVDYFSRSTKWSALIPWTSSAALKTGAEKNQLKVITQGNQIAVYANDQFLDTITDATLSRGAVGFVTGSSNTNSKVTFDNLSISKINRTLTLPTPKPRPPTPTPLPAIPAGMGGVIVDNFCGFDVNIDVGGKFNSIPVGGRAYIYLPPGHYAVSATAGGKKLVCGGGGCGLDVTGGTYISYPYCAGQ